MATSRDLPTDRQAIGQLLVRLLHAFRREMLAPIATSDYADIREPHLQIFGNIRAGGVRLTELAARAQLSLAAASELVNDLESLGYLHRGPDPTDGRAKLIDLTERGHAVLATAGDVVAGIEQSWARAVGPREFAEMCATMQHLLDALDATSAPR